MTINATPRKAGPYIGNGSVHTYGFSFKVLDPTHLTVVEATAAGVEVALILASDYTVLLNEDQEATPGGAVTRVVETVPTALPLNYRWTILSATPYSQAMDLPSGGPFSAVVVENGLDNLEIQVQQVVETLERAVLVPPTSGTDPQALIADLVASSAGAAGSAAAAAASETAAAASETAAAGSATAASGSATAAAGSATAASGSATAASGSATAASGSASAAATSATNAGNSASAAATSATNAGNSATAASGSASAAATSATNAGNSATAASSSASAASTSATNASNSASAAAVGNGGRYSATVGGTANAITLTPAVALGAYAAGEAITFIVASTNTGAVTVDVSGLGAKAVTKTGATALVAGELVAGQIVTLRYDGTRYQAITPAVGTAAAKNTGASGATVPLCSNADTTFGTGATGANLRLNGAAGTDRVVYFQTNGSDRMAIDVTTTAESGSNAGSDLAILNYSDAGVFLQAAVQVRRSDGAVLIGAPAGGFKGFGTLNAHAVYDDNVLLTCYAIEAELTGKVTKARWNDSALNRELTQPDGQKTVEVTTHEAAARFAPRAADMLDPKRYGELWRATGHLAAMPSPAEWEAAGKKMAVGDIVQRLWETVEVQAIHIDKLLARIEALEAKP
jgi:hypothetical protein